MLLSTSDPFCRSHNMRLNTGILMLPVSTFEDNALAKIKIKIIRSFFSTVSSKMYLSFSQ